MSKKKSGFPWGFTFISIILFALVIGVWRFSAIQLENDPNRGTYGDMFGAVNALFSGLAFTGIIITILLQRQELSLQREELAYTRDEIRGQKEQLEQQNKTLIKQNFENTFFSLLKNQNDIIESISGQFFGMTMTSGRPAFRGLYMRLTQAYINMKDGRNPEPKYYNVFYKDNHEHIAHYFQHLTNLISFIDQSEIENKRFYTSIVRAQLSNYEAALLCYHGNHERTLNLKSYIEKYGLLSLLHPDMVFEKSTDLESYSKSAFTI